MADSSLDRDLAGDEFPANHQYSLLWRICLGNTPSAKPEPRCMGNTAVLIWPSHSLIVSDQLSITFSPCNHRYNSTDYTRSDSRDLARADVFDYIEVFYNRTRRHSHLGGVSPEAFEAASL
jgi:transposase InsO family protein